MCHLASWTFFLILVFSYFLLAFRDTLLYNRSMTLKSCIRNGGYYHLKNGKKSIVFSKCIFSAICSNCKNLFFTVVPKQYACSHHCGLVLSRGNGKFINCFNCRKPIWKT